jgi:CBS domain-containing protein
VLRYTPGKADWLAAGLPTEGTPPRMPRVGRVVRTDVVTCGPDDPLAKARARVAESRWPVAVVVNAERVVLGLLDEDALAGGDVEPAESAMELAPTTYRPGHPLDRAARWMWQHRVEHALVTTGDGVLVGLLVRADAEGPTR